jgi:hypothetical protein
MLLLLLALPVLRFTAYCKDRPSPAYPFKHGTMRAVSISSLQTSLQKKTLSRSEKQLFSNLCGIRRLEGFALDRRRGDIVLYGWTAPDLPELYLDDFVVALRNAALMYAVVKDDTRYYAAPGCSIDPDPKIVEKLGRMAQALMATNDPKKSERLIDEWMGTCKAPQGVRVLGLPLDSRFAAILVKADYDMKLIADGSDSLGIPALASFTGMTLSRIRECVLADKPVPQLGSLMNRFWFYPDAVEVRKSDGMYLLSDCRVKLLTEESYLMNLEGQVTKGTRSNPVAQKFVEDFSAAYNEIARIRPIYRELENMFRFFALARVVIDFPENSGCDINFLLKSYTTAGHRVEMQVPGHAAMQHFDHTQKVRGGLRQISLSLPSCGGVSIDIESGSSIVKKADLPMLVKTKAIILRSRPAPDAVWWECGEVEEKQLKGDAG